MNPNQDRADRFDAVVQAYGSDDPCENLIDLLTDAMHWADDMAMDFQIAFAHACRHYVHELDGPHTDERK